ncbi:MAG: type II toxin-antitoxin system RelE/ParE family toxin [Acidobacteria bacterium]|nr:MAG: type II toxin-antitoxin system RelE/ParE family toxin [Acidobacteriota bacterium]
MTGFVLHPEAYNDVDEIWEYIAADNLVAADRVLDEIYQMLRSLVAFPQQGHSRPDLTARPLRFQSVRDYVIAYAADEKPLIVIAVLHGRRSPRVIAAILRQRD